MCVHCDAVKATVDIIEEFGWAVSTCEAGDEEHPHVPFAYSTGLTGFGLPEVIVYGLETETGLAVINYVASRLIDGDDIRHGRVVGGVLAECDVTFVDAIDTEDFGIAHDVYESVVALQVVWPDDGHRFPWDPGYALDADCQPLMGVLR